MPRETIKCWECRRDHYPNELREVEETVAIKAIVKKLVCRDCIGTKSTLGDIETNKRNAAKATAWNNGQGWGV